MEREDFRNIRKEVGHTVLFRARIQSTRPMSAKLAFIVFRQQLFTVQGVIRATDEEGGVSEHMVRWAEKLPRETVVLVEGKVREAEHEVISTEIHKLEMDIVKVSPRLPFTLFLLHIAPSCLSTFYFSIHSSHICLHLPPPLLLSLPYPLATFCIAY